MARPKTSVDRLANLRKTFQSNKGKVLSVKQVQEAVGASYWRACIKDLKAEGLGIEAIRDSRAVVGYKCVDISTTSARSSAQPAAVAASKPKKATKAAKKPAAKKAEKPVVKAKKEKSEPKATPKKKKSEIDVAKVIEETPAGEEDPDVLAILQQAGLSK